MNSLSPTRCCVVLSDLTTTVQVKATQFYTLYGDGHTKDKTILVARQYECRLPALPITPHILTLTNSSVCPRDPDVYVKIEFPPKEADKLGLCGKVVHDDGVLPSDLIEWFEMQVSTVYYDIN